MDAEQPDEGAAAAVAADYGHRHLEELGPRHWSGLRFDGGWRMTPDGDDLTWRFGTICLIVLDDGRVFEESASEPPDRLVGRYLALLAGEADDPMGRAHGA